MTFLLFLNMKNRIWLNSARNLKRLYHSKTGVYGAKPVTSLKCSIHEDELKNRILHSNIYRLVTSYRENGHRIACYDPLNRTSVSKIEELELCNYGITENKDLINLTGLVHIKGQEQGTISQLIDALKNMYCGTLSVEFMHIQNSDEREWFSSKFEEIQNTEQTNSEKVESAKLMLRSQAFDQFVGNKFATVKRYGGEGAESAMVFYDHVFKMAANSNIKDVVVCTAHRGRLNLLSCIMNFPPVTMFRKMKGLSEFPPGVQGTGDVLSHFSNSVDLNYGENNVHVTMVPNPSHLEAVNPVAVGKTRSKMRCQQSADYSSEDTTSQPGDGVLCLQLHGDAAFAGQGIVAETIQLADVPHFSVGGSVHFIINNQLGFTTEQHYGRSSLYSSCIGKLNNCPVLRVNADYPEDVIRACELAMQYRDKFRKDVIVDYVCYRRWGHNEVDEPAITQPIMYDIIRNRQSIPDLYREKLLNESICSAKEIDEVVTSWNRELSENLNQVESHIPKANHLERQWAGLVQPSDSTTVWDTGVDIETLKFVGAKSVTLPSDFNVHHSLSKTHIEKRIQKLEDGIGIDWATAEAMAMGSLIQQGYHVRISGQDVGRGTFSQRHCMFVDQETDDMYIPLNNINTTQTAYLEVCNSPLSEEAVLAFEYGVSVDSPNILAVWEAQFGDFFNGAQIIIDTFISCGETKWLLQSGLVMLLPHGMDGTGPEHSSCRMERFLQLCDSKEDGIDGDNVNMQIVNPTTPAQYFHLLRRQMVRNFRKPLIVVGPKVLLRLGAAVSNLADLAPGTTFHPVLGDPSITDSAKVTKVVFLSGKHYYTLANEKEKRGVKDMAVIRIESLCPFPVEEIRNQVNKYPNATDFMWSQEEHRNQGAWSFVNTRFENIVGRKLRFVGRDVHATPATGIGQVHREETQQILEDTFA